MKLIEKKCPNCGASLEFRENDKSCRCDYCGRSFEIERKSNDSNIDISQNYFLNEIKTGLKIIPIIFGAIFSLSIIIIIVVAFSISKSDFFNKSSHSANEFNNNYSNLTEEIKKQTNNNESYFSSIDELSNDDFSSMDNNSIFKIPSIANGVNTPYHSYIKDGDSVRKKVYVAYKEGTNRIISIYLVNYKDFYNQENNYTLYIPIVYQNIKNNNSINKFNNSNIQAPEFYFNDDHSSYINAYGDLNDLYNDLIKVLIDDGYKVTESM